MCGSSRSRNDDFDAAFFGGRRVFEQQIGGAVSGDYARFMWNAEIGERFGGVFHGFPVGRRAHDNADERLRVRRSTRGAGHGNGDRVWLGFRGVAAWTLAFFGHATGGTFAPFRWVRRTHILRCFSAGRELRALLPIVAKLPDKVERAGDEDG